MHPNSFDLVAALIAMAAAVAWLRARRRATTSERRAARAMARAEVVLMAAESFHEQLTERERAVAAGRIETRRRHLHLVRRAS